MILWRLRGAVSEVSCALECTGSGWRLTIRRRRFVEYVETFADAGRARSRADAVREKLLTMGFQLA